MTVSSEGSKAKANHQPVALPFDESSPEYEQMLKKIETAYKTLPPGWRRGEQGKDEPYAPFIHDEDKKYVWKHPGRDQIEQIMKDAQNQHPEAWSDSSKTSDAEETRWLKKFRKMLQSGIPQAAVEQRARLQGIDPAKIFQSDEGEDAKQEEEENPGINIETAKEKSMLEKSRKMLENGIPQGAVEQRLRIAGIDPSNLFSNMDKSKENKNNIIQDTNNEKEDNTFFCFIKVSDKDCVEFPSLQLDGKMTNESYIATLTKKMVQTVRKRTGNILSTNIGLNKKHCLTVEAKDIYNALGSFRGVQHSRDLYNSTISNSSLSQVEKMSKQKQFLKFLSSLGIRPPQTSNEKVDIEGLDDLVKSTEQLFRKQIKSFGDLYMIGLFDFNSLSNLYRPGTQVLAKNAFISGVEMMCKVSWSRFEEGRTLFGVSKTFRVCFQYLFAVGNHFALCEVVEGIDDFEGRKPLEDLDFLPVQFMNERDFEQKKEIFHNRGMILNKCGTKSNFLAYSKGSFFTKSAKGENGLKSQISCGRIMVDTQGSYEAGHSLSVGYDPMVMAIKQKYKEYKNLVRQIRQRHDGKADGSTKNVHEVELDINVYGDGSLILFNTIPEDFLLMTWPAVAGFSFTSKLWGDVLVDGLSNIRYDNNIFDKLVLPSSKKRMIKALVSHTNSTFSDIVSGKGEGSVFLLYGPPGVGKTLTAEAISEMLHRPLYSIALGQLGITPRELETKLDAILELCSKWDAVVLLDEADIFLEKRNFNGSLERNAMVSVMLRLVEYFKGVLFLTSNRVESLDPAFKTRITLALRYEHLDVLAREKIWSNLLLASGHETSLSNGKIDIKNLAKYILNGREIKNALRLALALASEDGKSLDQDVIVETVESICDFNEKMNSGDNLYAQSDKKVKSHGMRFSCFGN